MFLMVTWHDDDDEDGVGSDDDYEHVVGGGGGTTIIVDVGMWPGINDGKNYVEHDCGDCDDEDEDSNTKIFSDHHSSDDH